MEGLMKSVNDYTVWRFLTVQNSPCGLLLAAFGSCTNNWSILLKSG